MKLSEKVKQLEEKEKCQHDLISSRTLFFDNVYCRKCGMCLEDVQIESQPEDVGDNLRMVRMFFWIIMIIFMMYCLYKLLGLGC